MLAGFSRPEPKTGMKSSKSGPLSRDYCQAKRFTGPTREGVGLGRGTAVSEIPTYLRPNAQKMDTSTEIHMQGIC